MKLRLLLVRGVIGCLFIGHPEALRLVRRPRPGGHRPVLRVSLDRALGNERCGTAWAIAQLAAGAELVQRLSQSAEDDPGEPTQASADGAEAPLPAASS